MRHHVAIIVAGVTDDYGRLLVFTSGDDELHNSHFLAQPKVYNVLPSGIQSLSAFSSAIDDGASIATSGVTSLTIRADDYTLPIGYRPIDIFARVGAESLSASQVWATQALAAGDTAIDLADGVAQNVRHLHIGTEAIYLSQTAPASGSVAITTRGDLMTLAAPHRANLSGFLARTIPVTSVPVEWIGRRVYVYIDDTLWRIMVLTDNPHVDAYSVTLSMIDVCNVLSIAKKSSQVPAYATTLSPQTINLRFDLFCSRPSVSIAIAEPLALQTTPALFAPNGHMTGGFQLARDMILLWYDWKNTYQYQYRYGWNGIPEMTLRLVAYQMPDEAITLPMAGGAGAQQLNAQLDCYFGPPRNVADLSNFYTQNYSYRLRGVELGAVTYWAGLGLSYLGDESSDWAAPGSWNDVGAGAAPWAARLREGSERGRVALKSRYCAQVGWPNAAAIPSAFAVGIIWRRNLNSGDDRNALRELATARTLVDGLYNRWSHCDEYNTTGEGPATSAGGYSPDYVHCFYPVRPRDDGDVHNVVVTDAGIVMCADGWWWGRTLASGGIDVDYCKPGCWWEPGIATIQTTAPIPLAGMSGRVEIRWQEPSGVWLRALATVTYLSQSGGIYTYRIAQDVRMRGGEPCVGFGSWQGYAPCQITPPTFVDSGYIGDIAAKIIASGDSTSGRVADALGDGYGVPISGAGMLSFAAMSAGGLGALYRCAPDEDLSYDEWMETACRITGAAIVGRMTDAADTVAGWGPYAVPMGRPMPHEKVAEWTDADLIGIPSTTDGYAGVVYTSYSITLAERHWQINDWLAGDLLGQGEELELDLTPLIPAPWRVTDDDIAELVGTLRDRYGVLRRRWAVRVPIERAIALGVGDVVAITSAYLVDPAGGLGVANRLARILSITHDYTAAVSDVEMIAYAEYGAGWNVSQDVLITAVSGTTYTLQILGDPTSQDATDIRREHDITRYPPVVDSTVLYLLVQTEGTGAGGTAEGYFTAWNAATHTATFIRTTTVLNPALTANNYGVIIPSTSVPSVADLFQLGRDRLL